MESRMYKPFTRTHTFSTSQRTPLQKCEGGQIHYYEENIKRISSGCVDIYTGDEMFDWSMLESQSSRETKFSGHIVYFESLQRGNYEEPNDVVFKKQTNKEEEKRKQRRRDVYRLWVVQVRWFVYCHNEKTFSYNTSSSCYEYVFETNNNFNAKDET